MGWGDYIMASGNVRRIKKVIQNYRSLLITHLTKLFIMRMFLKVIHI